MISKEDYHSTLGAYGVASESGMLGRGGRTFEQDCRLKLARAIGKSPEEAWNMLAGTQQSVSISEFRSWLDTLSENIRDREKVTLLMYYAPEDTVRRTHFIQDVKLLQGLLAQRDAGSLPPVDKKPFLRQPVRVETAKKLPALSKPIFTVESREMQQKALTDKREEFTKEQNLQLLHDKIASRVPFSNFLLGGLEWGAPRSSTDSKKKLEYLHLKGLMEYLNTDYGTVLGTMDRSLLLGFWDVTKKGNVSISTYKSLFRGCTKDASPFAELSLAILARNLDNEGISTSAYLKKLGGADTEPKVAMSVSTATFMLVQCGYFEQDEVDIILKSVQDVNAPNIILPRKIIEAINKFRGPADTRPSEYFEARFKLTTNTAWNPNEQNQLTKVMTKLLRSKKPTIRTWLRQLLQKGDVVDIDVVKTSVKSVFKPILSDEEILVLQDALDIKNIPKLSIDDLLSGLRPGYSNDFQELSKLHLGLQAILLDREGVATSDRLTKMNLSATDYISSDEFMGSISNWLKFPEDKTIRRESFAFLSDSQQRMPVSDLISYVNFFRKKSPLPSEEDTILKGNNQTKPQKVETTSQNKAGSLQKNQVVERVKNALAKQKVSALQAYRLADPEERDETSVISMKRELQRLAPDLDPSTLMAIVKIADTRRTGFIKREDWELLLMTAPEDLVEMEEEQSRRDLSQSLINDNMSVISTTSKKSTRAVTFGDPVNTLMTLTAQLQKEEKTPEQFYEEIADGDDSKYIPSSLFYQALLKLAAKSAKVKKPELASVLRHVDIQRRGFVSKGDVIAALQPMGVPLVDKQNIPMEEGLPELKLPRHSSVRQPVVYEPRHEITDSEFHDLIHELKEQISKNGVQLKSLFESIADLDEFEPIPVLTLASRLQEKLPSFNKQKLIKIMRYVDINKNGLISKEEFEVTIGYDQAKDEVELSTYSRDAAAIDTNCLLAVQQALQKRDLDTNRLFDYSDIDRDGLITILDLKTGYERLFSPLPEDMPQMLDFLKGVRHAFKTSRFSKQQLNIFMEQPDSMKIYRQIAMQVFPETEPALAKFKQGFKTACKQKTLQELGQEFDKDSDGHLSRDEFYQLLEKVTAGDMTPAEKEQIYKLLDKQALGKVKMNEFCMFVELEVQLESEAKNEANQFETVDARLMKGDQASTSRNPMQQLAGYMGLVSRMKQYRAVLSEMAVDLDSVYQNESVESDRKLKYPEFGEMFSKKINLGLDEFQMMLLFGEIDVNSDGGVSPEEFKSYLNQVASLTDMEQAKKLAQQNKMSLFLGKVDSVTHLFYKETGKDEQSQQEKYQTVLSKLETPNNHRWRNHSSIFTHPLAALKAAEDLIQLTKERNQKFFADQDFGPNVTDPTGDQSIVYREWDRSPLPNVSEYTWLRPHEISTRSPALFMDPNQSSLGDIIQGLLGDCWFLSSLITISAKRKYLVGSLEGEQDLTAGVYPPLFHSFREYGLYVMRFCVDDEWVYVIIDDRLPVSRDSRSPFLTHSYREDIFWPALIEKAYAKLHGKYHKLQTGTTHEGITDCTGLFSQRFDLSDNSLALDTLWPKILHAYNRGGMLAGSIRQEHHEQAGTVLITETGRNTGLYKGHAYSVVGVYELPQSTTGKEYPVQLVRLRNPWGNRESVIEWSDYSEEIIRFKQA